MKTSSCLPFLKKTSLKKIKTNSHTHYSLVSELKKSTFPIYIVKLDNTSQAYVMKVFPYKEGFITNNYEREAYLASLSHPNIVRVIQTQQCAENLFQGKFSKASYIIMELAPYGDFCDLMAGCSLPAEDAVVRTYFHQLIDGIEYLHSRGIAHMDLKLENLLIDENYNLRITDFDACHFDGKITCFGKGTQNYRPPELKTSRCPNSRAADIYSAGILLFVLKFQVFPYLESTIVKSYDLEKMLLSGDASFWEAIKDCHGAQCDDEFKALFMTMVRPNPEDRGTISEIKKSNWYNGPILSNRELKEAMKDVLNYQEGSPLQNRV
jgi:carbon catabolite-derepressing protein kinase